MRLKACQGLTEVPPKPDLIFDAENDDGLLVFFLGVSQLLKI
jgi:hypothetical protein